MCSSQTLLPASWRRAVITCSLSDLCSYRPLVLGEIKTIVTWSFYWSRCRMCHCCSDPCFSCRVSGCSDEGEFILNPLNTITSRTRSGQLHVEFNVWAFCMKCFRAESIVLIENRFFVIKVLNNLISASWTWSCCGFFCHSELNIFGLWTKQDLRTPSWKQLSIIFTIFFYFIHQTTYRLVKKPAVDWWSAAAWAASDSPPAAAAAAAPSTLVLSPRAEATLSRAASLTADV